MVQGQGGATPLKLDGLEYVLIALMSQARRSRISDYWIFDAHAGSGRNHYVQIDGGISGSPIIAHRVADKYLGKKKRNFIFCDRDETAINHLHGYLAFAQECDARLNWKSTLICDDNKSGLDELDFRLGGEKPSAGCILLDPNGTLPTSLLLKLVWFFERHSWFDIFWNCNVDAYRRGKCNAQSVIDLRSHWWIRGTPNGRWMQAVGSEVKDISYTKGGFVYLGDNPINLRGD